MYRAICGTYVNSSPAGGPSSHPTPGRGEGVPCTPQANAPVPTATSAGSYSVATSRAGRKFTGLRPLAEPGTGAGWAGSPPPRAARWSRGPPRGPRRWAWRPGEPSTVTRGAEHCDPESSVSRWDRNGPEGPEGSRPGSPWTGARRVPAASWATRDGPLSREGPAWAKRRAARRRLPGSVGPSSVGHRAVGHGGIGQSASRIGADGARGG
jgi:hypothetical protein